MKNNEQVKVVVADYSQKELIRRLINLYKYELSDFSKENINQFGLFEYKYLDHYWIEAERIPYLIYYKKCLAGFALVNKHVLLAKDKGAFSIAEYFVVKKYQRLGIGRVAAKYILDYHPGKWEVAVLKNNNKAIQFWKHVISKATGGNYIEQHPDTQIWEGPVFSFEI